MALPERFRNSAYEAIAFVYNVWAVVEAQAGIRH